VTDAQTWVVLGMGFTLFSWLLLQMRGIENRLGDLDRRVSEGFIDVQRQFGDVQRQFSDVHRQFGEVNGQLAEIRADLRLHQQRDH
jgi:hypothetical protein